MVWDLLVLVTAVALALLLPVFPSSAPPSRWRLRLHERCEAGWVRWRHRHDLAVDPFEVLHLQTRLTACAQELRRLEVSREVYAKAHRMAATRAAYDALLREACLLAGVPVEAGGSAGSEADRSRREFDLAERGWSW